MSLPFIYQNFIFPFPQWIFFTTSQRTHFVAKRKFNGIFVHVYIHCKEWSQDWNPTLQQTLCFPSPSVALLELVLGCTQVCHPPRVMSAPSSPDPAGWFHQGFVVDAWEISWVLLPTGVHTQVWSSVSVCCLEAESGYFTKPSRQENVFRGHFF